MQARCLDSVPEDGQLHDLIRNCRRSDADSEFIEPTWVAQSDGDWIYLWSDSPPNGTQDPPLLLVEQCDRPDWETVLVLWRRYRELTPLEKGLIISYLPKETVEANRKRLAELVDLPASGPLFEALQKIDQLPKQLQDKLHGGQFSLRLVRYLMELPDSFYEVVVEGISKKWFKLSVQEMRKLGEATRRLSDEKRKTWIKRVKNLDKADKHPREVGSTLLKLTRDLAYPRTMKRRRRFEEDLKVLEPDGRISVTPPKNFEGDYLDFKIRCRRDEDIIKLSEELKRCKKLLQHL
ncbi:MAG: hypothetical protein ABEK50_08645 [bacterium]